MDDQALLHRVAQRDEEAFRLVYQRHSAVVYGLLCRLAGRQVAAALLHETWLRALRHLPLFHGQSPFRIWLTGIALNCYRDSRRRRPRNVQSAEADSPQTPPGAAADEAAADEAAAISRVLGLLAPEYREMIVLHDIEGLPSGEIAAALECDVATATHRLSRARRSFRQHWSHSDAAWSADDEALLLRARVSIAPAAGAQESLVTVLCDRGLLRRRSRGRLAAWLTAGVIVVLAAWPLWARGCG